MTIFLKLSEPNSLKFEEFRSRITFESMLCRLKSQQKRKEKKGVCVFCKNLLFKTDFCSTIVIDPDRNNYDFFVALGRFVNTP